MRARSRFTTKLEAQCGYWLDPTICSLVAVALRGVRRA